MANSPATRDLPGTADMSRVLGMAARVVVIEEDPFHLDRAGAARITVRGAGIVELAQRLAVVDSGTEHHCLCVGWPTILVFDALDRTIAQWTLHHQTHIRGLAEHDAELRDGPGLTDWLADHGVTGPRETQRMLADREAASEQRRLGWVAAAPPGLTEAAEATSRREPGAEELLTSLTTQHYPNPPDRVLALVAWAGFPPRHTIVGSGTPWHELAPQRMLLAEPAGSVVDTLAAASLTPPQLDGAAELFACLEWLRSPRIEIPGPLRSLLVAHVTRTGTDPMRFRMVHG